MEPSRRFHHEKLPLEGVAVLAGAWPPGESTFKSEHLQTLYADVSESWSDVAPHIHTSSDEVFIVLAGSIVFDVAGVEKILGAGEFCCFPAGLSHAVVRSNPPTRHLVIRAPSVADKVYE